MLKTLLITGLTLLATQAQAEVVADRVIAVVNKSVLTKQDLDKRFQLSLRQARHHVDAAQQRALYNRTLNDLINEEIQRQYAYSTGLSVNKNEMDLAIAQVEQKNGLSHGGFYNLTKGLTDTAKKKIEADLLWNKIIEREVKPRVVVSTQEVDQLIKNLKSKDKITEKEVYQIFIDGDKEGAQKAAQDAYNIVKKDITVFPQIAATVSDASNAADGGFLGWVKEGELRGALNDALEGMTSGTVSKPIETTGGWHILAVKSMRETAALSTKPIPAYRYYELTISYPDNEKEAERQRSLFTKAVSNFKRLGDAEEFVLTHKETLDVSGEEHPLSPTVSMPKALVNRLQETKQGHFSDISTTGNTDSVVYVISTEKVLPVRLQKMRDNLSKRLSASRLDMMSRRFMRDMRRSSYIDIRP